MSFNAGIEGLHYYIDKGFRLVRKRIFQDIFLSNKLVSMRKILILIVVCGSFTSCYQWYALLSWLGIRHYYCSTNYENFLDNNWYDSIHQTWVGPDSARINFLEEQAKKIEMRK